jgi:hypothetical protein
MMSFLLIQTTFSASFTSVMDGNWSSPFTWGETMIIPQPGDEVTINHTVTLDDQFTVGGYWSVDAGSLTIGVNGILQAGDNVLGIAILNNGTIINNGQFNIPQLGNYEGAFTNNSTCSFNQLIYNADYLENNGDIFDLDSVLTIGEFYNNINSNFYTDSIWIEGVFENNGSMFLHEITNNGSFTNNANIEFRRLTNLGVFDNYDVMTGSIDMTNAAYFKLWDGASLSLTNSFLNADSVDHKALFVVEGEFNIGHNFLNVDTIRGSIGQINVQDSSMNVGWFKETFYFCDATPPSVSPFVDYNTGSIEGSVRYCTSVGVKSLIESQVDFYPNPAKDVLFLNQSGSINITDISGKVCLNIIAETTKPIDISALNKGLYIMSIENKNELKNYQLIIE